MCVSHFAMVMFAMQPAFRGFMCVAIQSSWTSSLVLTVKELCRQEVLRRIICFLLSYCCNLSCLRTKMWKNCGYNSARNEMWQSENEARYFFSWKWSKQSSSELYSNCPLTIFLFPKNGEHCGFMASSLRLQHLTLDHWCAKFQWACGM